MNQKIIRQPEYIQADKLNPLSVDIFLGKLFDKYDLNSDGRLTWFEFTQVLKFLTKVTGSTFPKKHDINDIFERIDQDGDTTITKQQYHQLTKHLKPLIQNLGVNLLYKGKI